MLQIICINSMIFFMPRQSFSSHFMVQLRIWSPRTTSGRIFPSAENLGLWCHLGNDGIKRKWKLGPLVLFLPKKLIIWLSNLSILSVRYEGYYRNASCKLNLISTFLFGLVDKIFRMPTTSSYTIYQLLYHYRFYIICRFLIGGITVVWCHKHYSWLTIYFISCQLIIRWIGNEVYRFWLHVWWFLYI